MDEKIIKLYGKKAYRVEVSDYDLKKGDEAIFSHKMLGRKPYQRALIV